MINDTGIFGIIEFWPLLKSLGAFAGWPDKWIPPVVGFTLSDVVATMQPWEMMMFFCFTPLTSTQRVPEGTGLAKVGVLHLFSSPIPRAYTCTLSPQHSTTRNPIVSVPVDNESSKLTNVCVSGKPQIQHEMHSTTNNHRTLLLNACFRDEVCAFPTTLMIKIKHGLLPRFRSQNPYTMVLCADLGKQGA